MIRNLLKFPAAAILLAASLFALADSQIAHGQTINQTVAVCDPANPTNCLKPASSTGSTIVQGDVAAGATDSGNPVKGGGVFYTTPSSSQSLSNGQRGAFIVDNYGNQRVQISTGLVSGSDGVGNTVLTSAVGAGNISNTGNANPFVVAPYVLNGSGTWDRARGDTNGQWVVASPGSAAGNAIQPVVTSAVASSLVIKASAGNLYRVDLVAGASAGFLLIFDATSAPADGAVTPIKCFPVVANGFTSYIADPAPARFATGITAVFSTTGCFTKTASATAFISGEAK